LILPCSFGKLGHRKKNMKKFLWILAIGLVGLVGSTVYYYWTEATATPDWYKEAAAESEPASPSPSVPSATAPLVPAPSTMMLEGKPLDNKISAAPSPSPTATATIASPVPTPTNSVAASPKPTVKPLPGVKAIKTQIRQETLRSGALLDLAAMESLPAGQQSELVKKLLTVMPQLRGREIYIGVNGKLIEQNGRRQLSTDSKLAIGKVELPLDDVASQMNLSRSKLDQMILSYLQLDQPPTP
jgi:hypothetical protein